MRTLAASRTRGAARIVVPAAFAALLGLLVDRAAACTYPSAGTSTDNVFSLNGSAPCTVPPNSAYMSGPNKPLHVVLPVPYTGYVFLAYNHGSISASGGTLSLTSTSTPSTAPITGVPLYGAYGAWSDGGPGHAASINFNSATAPTSVTVTTSLQTSYGLYASSGGQISSVNPASSLSVSTAGQDSHAVFATGAGSLANLGGTTKFTTSGNGAIGLYATAGGAISATGQTTISTSGTTSGSTGLSAFGVNADGAYSQITLGSATITTSGAGATGLFASDAMSSGSAGSIYATGPLTISTTSANAAAVALQGNGASIVATGGGSIVSAGDAIDFLGGTGQTATFDNFNIANQSGNLIAADPSFATVNFNDTVANAGTGALLDAVGGSSVTLNASASMLTGTIQTDKTSTTALNLTNGSIWSVTGSSHLSNLVVTNSVVVFAPPTSTAPFKTLTLSGYTGSGASIVMNAMPGGTGPGQQSDQIVINGSAPKGSTPLTVNTGGVIGKTTGPGIPLVLTNLNAGTTVDASAFTMAPQVVDGFQLTLQESGGDWYLISAPTVATQTSIQNSVNTIAKDVQQQTITGRVLTSILLGATEQVNCSNCSSGFGSIGSYAIGAHGRWSLTNSVTLMGGFSYDEYSAAGITVYNAPTFAGSLVYDPVNFGRSRPFVEVGGGLVPFEQVKYSRSYVTGAELSVGQGQGLDRSLGLFGRVGWVDRFTPVDEGAVYTDISRSWLSAGGYTEAANAVNPLPATVKTGIDTLDVARLGAQYTHLFNGQFEGNVSVAVSYGFNAGVGSQWDISGYGPVVAGPIANSVWYEWGARVGYRVAQRMVVDAFVLGTLGGEVGTTFHGGVGLRYLF